MKATLITTLLAAFCCQAAPEVTVDCRTVSCQFNPEHRTEPGLSVLFDLKTKDNLVIRPSDSVSGNLVAKDALGRDLGVRLSSITCSGKGVGAGCLLIQMDSAPTCECVTVTGNLGIPVADVKEAVTSEPLEGIESGSFTLEGVEFTVKAAGRKPQQAADGKEAEALEALRMVEVSFADNPSVADIGFVDKNGRTWPVLFSDHKDGRHTLAVVYDSSETQGSLALKMVCSGNPHTIETPVNITFGLGGAMQAPATVTKTSTTLPTELPKMKASLKRVMASKAGEEPYAAAEFALRPGCFLLTAKGSLELKDKEGKEIQNLYRVQPTDSTLSLLIDRLPENGRMELDTAVELDVYAGTSTRSGIRFDPVEGWSSTLDGVKIALKPVTADELKYEYPDKASEALYLEVECEPMEALADLELRTADGDVLDYADIAGREMMVRENQRLHPIILALPFEVTEAYLRVTVRRGLKKLSLPIKGVITAGGFLQEGGTAPAAKTYEEYYTFDENEEPTFLYEDHLKAAKEETPLLQAIWDWEGALKVERLLNQGADIHAVTKLGGMTPLHMAAAVGHNSSPADAKALLERGAAINVLDAKGQTPLMYAAWRGNPATLKLLLERGADSAIKHKGKYGLAALHLAAMRSPDKVGILLKHGADVNIRSDYDGSQPIHWACSMGGEKSIQLLLEAGADINARTAAGETPLHWSVTDMNIMVHHFMFKQGADVNARDQRGRTPLHFAAVAGTAVAETLLKQGADVNAQDNEGNTPLHIAAHYGDRMLTSILLKGGADASIRRKDGKTPLEVAEANEGLRIVDNQVLRSPKSMTPKRNMHRAVIELLKQYELKDCAEDKGAGGH